MKKVKLEELKEALKDIKKIGGLPNLVKVLKILIKRYETK